ncbi:hypothetical protein [Trichococcus collinsii]|uniref:Uncharacterized protein n=1 Tax=Trichococcus collinsii TaxID=157076 RepID=A0AB37ZYE5_9LACT|nr:hypothetical protein [Trichococcus collinsii]CZR03527.1 Hypothetical protein Tcol_2165 [Trichococcus collinsii]SEA00143.1 hypothetical protein SAMN04488525_101835 [Trichococcus collinsii]
MKLGEAIVFVEGLGYSVAKVERRKLFRKAYTLYAEFLGAIYLFKLDKGKLYKKIPLSSGKCFWAELEEIG